MENRTSMTNGKKRIGLIFCYVEIDDDKLQTNLYIMPWMSTESNLATKWRNGKRLDIRGFD